MLDRDDRELCRTPEDIGDIDYSRETAPVNRLNSAAGECMQRRRRSCPRRVSVNLVIHETTRELSLSFSLRLSLSLTFCLCRSRSGGSLNIDIRGYKSLGDRRNADG